MLNGLNRLQDVSRTILHHEGLWIILAGPKHWVCAQVQTRLALEYCASQRCLAGHVFFHDEVLGSHTEVNELFGCAVNGAASSGCLRNVLLAHLYMLESFGTVDWWWTMQANASQPSGACGHLHWCQQARIPSINVLLYRLQSGHL